MDSISESKSYITQLYLSNNWLGHSLKFAWSEGVSNTSPNQWMWFFIERWDQKSRDGCGEKIKTNSIRFGPDMWDDQRLFQIDPPWSHFNLTPILVVILIRFSGACDYVEALNPVLQLRSRSEVKTLQDWLSDSQTSSPFVTFQTLKSTRWHHQTHRRSSAEKKYAFSHLPVYVMKRCFLSCSQTITTVSCIVCSATAFHRQNVVQQTALLQ